MVKNKFKVVIPVYNAENWVQKCIGSLYSQTYKNWDAVIINDNSTDGTLENIVSFIKEIPNKDKKRFRVFDRNQNKGALENIVYGIQQICEDEEEIIVLIDGDDWLASDDVLEHLNNLYQDNTWLTYGCLSHINNPQRLTSNQQVTNTRTYRTSQVFKTSHLRTFKLKIWNRIQDVDLRDSSGKYYSMAWDLAIMFPLIEMCGPHRIKCANKLMYIYNDQNPLNDHKKNHRLQAQTDYEIRKKLQYKELP